MVKAFSEGCKQNVINALSSVKVYSLNVFPHFLHPNNALFLNGNADDDDAFNPTLGVQATYPIPMPVTTNVNAVIEQNIVLKLVQQKNQYINDVAKITANFNRTCKLTKTKKSQAEDNVYSHHLNNLLELLEKDPDPHFFGAYNWYYTGGALETTSVCDVDFLFYVSGEKLNVFNSACLQINGNKLEVEHLDSTNQITCDTIFEIIKSGDNRFVAARQKRNVTVFYLQDECSQQDFKCERNIPFMSGTFHDNYFYSIDANRVIQKYDLTKNKECGKMYLKLPKNNSFWCQLKGYNNQLVFADEHKLKIYDSRLFGSKAAKGMQITFDSALEKCEEITCINSDDGENNLYVTSTHNLFVFDVRYGMESGNQLTRYTHQLKTPPLMMDASGGGARGTTANERLVVLSGTFTDDIAIAQHTKVQNDKLRTNNIPQRILSTIDSHRKLRQNGLQKEANSLTTRNRLVNIGTRFCRKDSRLFLVTEKASGELFQQEITQDQDGQQSSDNVDDKPLRNINLDNGTTAANRTFKATTVTNFDSIKRILKFNLPKESEAPDIENPPQNRWQQSISQLAGYKDMLSADLLSVWHVNTIVGAVEKPDKSEFVSGWVNRSTDSVPQDDHIDTLNSSQMNF